MRLGVKSVLIVEFIIVAPAVAASYPPAEKYLERALSTGIILSDSEVLSFGLHDFDPNELFNIHNDNIGSEEALQLRQQLAVTSLPYTFELNDRSNQIQHQITTRFSFLSGDNSVRIRQHPQRDKQDQLIVGAMSGYQLRYQADSHWSLTPGLAAHLQYYRNHHEYRSELSRRLVKPILDGVIYNTDAYAITLEPTIKIKYQANESWGKWNLNSTAHYFYGFGWGNANDGDVGNPEGWYLSNGVEAMYHLKEWSGSVHSLYGTLRRVDIGGDPSQPFGTNYYYESSFGWLMDSPFLHRWIDNIGLGLSINYGSAIKGGSIVLFFNQD